VRPLERAAEAEEDDERAELVRGYCGAVRSALTDDGRPPLVASVAVDQRLGRSGQPGTGWRASGDPTLGLKKLRACCVVAWKRPGVVAAVRLAYRGVSG